jgi:hypothetical protein
MRAAEDLFHLKTELDYRLKRLKYYEENLTGEQWLEWLEPLVGIAQDACNELYNSGLITVPLATHKKLAPK